MGIAKQDITSTCGLRWAFPRSAIFVFLNIYFKWIEVRRVTSTSAVQAITVLRMLFATHSLCDVIVSDTASTFTEVEFDQFLTKNGAKHMTSVPFYPCKNGKAERAVGSFKDGMRKQLTTTNINLHIARFLLKQHSTPHITIGVTPAELLMGHKLKINLDHLRPDLVSQVRQQCQHVDGNVTHSFAVNDFVWSCNYSSGDAWLPSVIVEITGPLSYRESFKTSGREMQRNNNQLKSATPHPPEDLVYKPFSIFAPQYRYVPTDAATLPSIPHAHKIVALPANIASPPVIDDTVPSTLSSAENTTTRRVHFAEQVSSPIVKSLPLPSAVPVSIVRRSA